MHVRASRTISSDHVAQLEHLVFGNGGPTRGQELLLAIDAYLQRPGIRWKDLIARVEAALLPPSEQPGEIPLAQVA